MRIPGALALALVTLGISTNARADELTATRAQPLTEVSHSVEVTIDRGVARYRVRRAFANAGKRSDEARLHIALPHGAAATGLRIRARNQWFEGELMEAQEARRKYQELTGVGAWEPKDPALLQWRWADELMLQVFPVLSGSVNTVEYTLTAPLEYREGKYILSYPYATNPKGERLLAEPVVSVVPGYGDNRTHVVVAGHRIAPDTPAVLSVPPPPPWVGEGRPRPGVGYAFSELDVTKQATTKSVKVNVDIDHTYSGDLRLWLVVPTGDHFELGRGEGSDNDIRRTFELQLAETETKGRWHLVVGDEAGMDVGTIDAWSLEIEPEGKDAKSIKVAARGLPVFIPDAKQGDGDNGHAMIEIAPPEIATLDARLGRVVASKKNGFERLELDTAPQLRPFPRKASVVFVLDASFSLNDEDLEEQLLIAEAYLSHIPDATVELVAVNRFARRGFGRFVKVSELADAIKEANKRSNLRLGNGSALETGLALAADILEDRGGPKRIVALTDELLRAAFKNEMAIRSLDRAPEASIAHLAVLKWGDAEIERDDRHQLAPIPASQHGVLFQLSHKGSQDKGLAPAVLGMVRPIGIDHFAVEGIDLKKARSVPKTMGEGTGYRAMVKNADPSHKVVLTGKIWAEDFRRVVRPTPHFNEATAAFVFSEDEHHDLSHAEMLKVAFAGRAVSPVTSYLATEPGVRPSWDGLEGSGRGEAFGAGGMGLIGSGAGGGGASKPDLPGELAPGVRACARKHKLAAGWVVELKVETTWREIVDFEVISVLDAKMKSCVVEAVWGTRLGSAGWPKRMTQPVTLRAK